MSSTKLCQAALLCTACVAPQPAPTALPASASDAVEPSFAYRHIPDASPPPAPLSPVGPNPGCPDLRVFADADAVCAHGIMAHQPYGGCERMRDVNRKCGGFCSEIVAERVDFPALDRHAELFVHHYISPGGVDKDEVFLALRGSNGYVILDQVAWFHSQINNPPEFEKLVGTPHSLELHLRQYVWEKELSEGRWGESDERWVFECDLDDQGGIRCQDECPSYAIDEPWPALDCKALAKHKWSTLSRGKRVEPDYEFDEPYWDYWQRDQFYAAADFVGLDWDEHENSPAVVREIGRGPESVLVVGLDQSHWVLLDDKVPLLASDEEIRMGRAPGGVYVSSHADGQRRIHRIHLSTHELEPVFPGLCRGD